MDQINERQALTVQQRVKRAQMMRRYKNKLERARKLAAKRFASPDKLKKRATIQARKILRARFAGKMGANYENLSPSEKISVDRIMDKKQALIKKLALRLIPKMRKIEQERMKSFMSGKKLENLGAKKGHLNEEINHKFKKKFEPTKKSSSKFEVVHYKKFSEEMEEESPAYHSLIRKANKSGVDINIIAEVYDRGLNSYKEDGNQTREQFAFARVNSYINKGRSYFEEDADLHEVSSDLARKYLLNRGKSIPPYNKEYHDKIRKWYGDDDEEVRMYDKDAARHNARLKSIDRAMKKVPDFDHEKEMKKYITKSSDAVKKYEGKLVHTSDDHPGPGISGYVVGTDPKKDNHVLVNVDMGKGIRGKGVNPKETHSVHVDHLREEFIREDHFKVGDSVQCVASGMTGKVVKLDPKEVGKYYSVKREDGKTVKYAPDDLKLISEETLDEGKMKEVSFDLDNLDHGNFKKKYGKSKDEIKTSLTSTKPVLKEGKSNPYVKPHYGDINNKEKQTAWRASNKHGKVKYFGLAFKHSANRHAGLNEEGNFQSNPLKRQVGTSELLKAFMKDTPGYENDKEIKEGDLAGTHTADYKMTKVRLPDGRVVWRRQKSNYDTIK